MATAELPEGWDTYDPEEEAELTEFAGTLLDVQEKRSQEMWDRAAYREKLKGLGFGYRWSHSS